MVEILAMHDCMEAGGRTTQDEYRTYSGENVRNKFSRQSRGAIASANNQIKGSMTFKKATDL
jgi:hypothetical protein